MEIIAILLICAGTFFYLTGTIGLLRFPDFYSRMHATGKSDTLGTLLSLLGLALCTGFSLTSVIALFVFLTSPTATHALLRAAFDSKIPPWTKDGKSFRDGEVRRN
jgi:multicomponent Na+:H+ antiporter subunit G